MPQAEPTEPREPLNLTDEQIIHGVFVRLANRDGTPFDVRVVEVPLPDFQKYFEAIALKNMALELELTTDKSVAELKELPARELLKLQNLSQRVNVDFFGKAVDEMTPAAERKLDQMIAGLDELTKSLENETARLASDTVTTASDEPDSPIAKPGASESSA